ncbi:MAG TPA: hypothetical protein VK034_19235, partial [Enhygromyxa sp.]|nr:hypothetical protein [Enhygromyxa sp.]
MSFALAKDSIFGREGREQLAVSIDVLRAAEPEQAARPQGKVKPVEASLLCVGLEINEQVPATHQVDMRKRRLGEHVVTSQGHHVTDPGLELIDVPLFDEELSEAPGRDMLGDARRIAGSARECNRLLAHVGGEHLQRHIAATSIDLLEEHHCQAERLFTGRAADRPDPDGFVR